MEGKKSFVLYADQREIFEELSNEDAGKLIKHIFAYISDENPESDDKILRLAFLPIKTQLKRDLKLWDEKKQLRSEAGKKGGLAKSSNAKQSLAKPSNATNDLANLAVNVNGNVNVNDINNNNIDYLALLGFVNKTFGRRFEVINDKTKRAYKARLKEGYTKEQIMSAITNAAVSKYHKDNNYQYCTPEFFSRAETIDKYSGLTIKTESDAILEHLKN